MIVIDTDPGLDDALAILFALRSPLLEVAALTSVSGNIGLGLTTANALNLVALAGSKVPVHPGADAPLARAHEPEIAIHGDDGLGGVVLPASPEAPAGSAIAALAQLLMEHPADSLDLHCLGPLTNIALLLDQAPEAAARIGRIIAMGGAVDTHGNFGPGNRAEFNLGQDPEAAQRVLHAGLDVVLIPLDATRQFRADAAWLAALRATGQVAAVTSADLVQAYFGETERESRPLHDPCVPLYALFPDLFTVETRPLQVDGIGALVEGPHPIRVAMGLDAPALRAHLLEGLAA
ncbi:nucleoside hydrolase [Pseudooceanicola sp. CBS1P-1]|uniref:Nucleoside hydrolase n=1 Tax=Pseudooceanicola albus TaxID=2692189 RepID=A0A6L7G3R6_9RHOB|nr:MULTISPECIES: nucleoside hydrolase [Pseudooceanicola]MBT9384996.1 nucleoside hydrolase [Pseudooceanicola endophyticus]MXN18010.1 nucleoside hydrolase [Pseudooceanicola albus]